MEIKINIGDKVRKTKGYQFDGTVVSVFKNTSGEERIVAELNGNGMLHIFNPSQLEKVDIFTMTDDSNEPVTGGWLMDIGANGLVEGEDDVFNRLFQFSASHCDFCFRELHNNTWDVEAIKTNHLGLKRAMNIYSGPLTRGKVRGLLQFFDIKI